ncbi:hypothetical protein ACFFNY_20600 [Paenibacillus hodogayensis]|uniref:Competence protein CoiA-like N-terminal domain-containing protein n=1 Tax=Paenibacillus hodogayensis TaxID=279208 RepID=A0ABV5W075_9BACL
MEWALNSSLQHVHASSSDAIRGLSYTCPRCRKETFLRKGKKRIAHFAHVSGQTIKDCELYVPPTIYASKVEDRIIDNLYEKTLDLYVEIEKENWSLHIKIPSPIGQYTGKAFLKIPFAWDGERTIPLSSVRSYGKKVKVRLQSQIYNVMVNGCIKDEWKKKVTHSVKGLDEDMITIFYFSKLGGRRLLQNTPLQWGDTYVLICNDQNIKTLFNLPPLIAYRKLKKINGWSALVIKLPTSSDSFVEQWIRNIFNKSVAAPVPQLRLVSPVSSVVDDQEAVVISPSDNVIIAVIGEHGAKAWSTINVQKIEEMQLIRHLGNGEMPILLSIGNLPVGRTEIWLDDDRQSALRLVCQNTIQAFVKISGVVFKGIYSSSGTKETYSLHSKDATIFFEMIQEYKFTLTDVNLPSNVALLLKTQMNETVFKKEKPTEIALTLNQALRQGNYVYLDAGGYGCSAIVPLKERETSSISMSTSWREQVKWILLSVRTMRRTVGMIRNDSFKGIDIKELRYLNRSDKELLLKVSKVEFIPVSMVPQIKECITEFLRTVSYKKTDRD